MENRIDEKLLKKLYLKEKNPISKIAKQLKRGEGTVLRYMRIYKIKSRPQHQLLGRKLSDKEKAHLSRINTGKKASKETREKMSKNRKGKTKNTLKIIKSGGYIKFYKPKHPMSDNGGYVPEHRFLMSEHLNRMLTKKEVVHHKNYIKDDNRIENLMLMGSKGKHTSFHNNLPGAKKKHSEQMKKIRSEKFWSSKKSGC